MWRGSLKTEKPLAAFSDLRVQRNLRPGQRWARAYAALLSVPTLPPAVRPISGLPIEGS
jgi:hypothetical protein